MEQKTELVARPFVDLQKNVINLEITKTLIERAELTREQIDELFTLKILPLMEENKDKIISPLSVAKTMHQTIQLQKQKHQLKYLHYVLFKNKKNNNYDLLLIPDVRIDVKTVLDAYNGEMDRIDTFTVTKDEIDSGKFKSFAAPKRELHYEENVLEEKFFKHNNINITDNLYYDDVNKGFGKQRIFGILVIAYNKKNYPINFKLYPIQDLVRISKRGSNYYQGEWKNTYLSDFKAMIEKTAKKQFCKFLALNADANKQSQMQTLLLDEEESTQDEIVDSVIVKNEDKNIEETKKLPVANKRKIAQKVSKSSAIKNIDKEPIKEDIIVPEVITDDEIKIAENEIKTALIPDEMKEELLDKLAGNTSKKYMDMMKKQEPLVEAEDDFDVWDD